jgi:hypothetical protein
VKGSTRPLHEKDETERKRPTVQRRTSKATLCRVNSPTTWAQQIQHTIATQAQQLQHTTINKGTMNTAHNNNHNAQQTPAQAQCTDTCTTDTRDKRDQLSYEHSTTGWEKYISIRN